MPEYQGKRFNTYPVRLLELLAWLSALLAQETCSKAYTMPQEDRGK
jgi:hypothetical protein